MNIARDEPINIAIWLATGLGLRRGEVAGLRWIDVNFNNNCVYIRNTRVQTTEGILEKGTKTEKGNRVLPIPLFLKKYLEKLYKKQMKNKLVHGKGFKYVCSWDDGSPVKLDYISRRFAELLSVNT